MNLSPEVKSAIKSLMDEMSASMTRATAEREFQREAVTAIAKEHELDKKILRKMARVYHRSNYATTKQDQAEFEIVYENLYGSPEE